MAIIGNTSTFEGKFYIEGELTDPDADTIYFRTYNGSITKLIEEIKLSETNKISTGIYRIDYLIPPPAIDMIYEFSGFIAGNTSLNRGIEPREYVSKN
jgi:hypothetical protein